MAGAAGCRAWAQPSTPPPTFEDKTEMGLVCLSEIARVKTFDPDEETQPSLRLTLRIEKQNPEITDPILVSVAKAEDDTGASLVSPEGKHAAALRGMQWGGGVTATVTAADGKPHAFIERTVNLLPPQPNAMTLTTLVLGLSYSLVNGWEEIHFDPNVTGAASTKEQSWARMSLQTYKVLGEGVTRQGEAAFHFKRIQGEARVSTYLFRYLLRDATGKEVQGYMSNAAAVDEGLSLQVRWMGLPADFKPTEVVFRFPASVDTKSTRATFKDVPLP